MPSVSSNSLKTRRQALASQRRWKACQSAWRFLAIGGLAGGAFWLVLLPYWTLSDRSQIEVAGNQLLSAQQIRSAFPLPSPQPIWKLPIPQLVARLEATPPIAEAALSRQLFPPQVKVTVRERQPVAVAPSPQGAGFLDAEGIWIASSFYRQAAQPWQPPALQVIGFEPSYRPYWQEMYPLIAQSAVKISAVDWRNPQNLILKTELGTVHIGPYSPEFAEKLVKIAQMRQLPSRLASHRLAYIDLTNPAQPTVQVKPQPKATSPAPNVKDRQQ